MAEGNQTGAHGSCRLSGAPDRDGRAGHLEQVDEVVARLEEAGASAHVSHGRDATVIGAIGERELLATLPLEGFPGVERVPHPEAVQARLARAPARPDRDRGARSAGSATPTSASSRGLHGRDARRRSRPRTLSERRGRDAARRRLQAAHLAVCVPGARRRVWRSLAEAREETGLPLVTELMDPRDVEAVVGTADVIQIGARNMQNFNLSPRSVGRRSRYCSSAVRRRPSRSS